MELSFPLPRVLVAAPQPLWTRGGERGQAAEAGGIRAEGSTLRDPPRGIHPEGSILSSAEVPAGAAPAQHPLLCREPGKEGVQESLGERDPLQGVELQHPPHQVKELRVLQGVVQHVRLQGTGDTQPGPGQGSSHPKWSTHSPRADPIPNTASPGLPPIPNAHPALASPGSLQMRAGAPCQAVTMGMPIPETPIPGQGREQHLPAGACSSPARICHQTCSHPTPGCHCGSIFASCTGKVGIRQELSLPCRWWCLGELRTRLLPSFVDHVRGEWPQDLFHHDKMLTVLMGLRGSRAVVD